MWSKSRTNLMFWSSSGKVSNFMFFLRFKSGFRRRFERRRRRVEKESCGEHNLARKRIRGGGEEEDKGERMDLVQLI